MMNVIFTVSALVSAAMAAVVPTPSFTLQAVAPGQQFDGMTLSLNGPLAGLNHTGDAVRFYASNGQSAFAWSLHGFPAGLVDTPAVLVGDSAFNLAFLTAPEQTAKQYGSKLMMDQWTFTVGRPSIKIAPTPGKYLGYNFEQKWYAFPGQTEGTWTVMWWDGSCCITQDGIPMKLKLVESDSRASS
ncbi:hypothetical protein TWF694_005265 [Orbilia ellipsospora]|uniref:Cellobiose dehydrogenase cytochrome domain-containing protein n=1 Tax=Orbilia ellipsospora TaxID=2528407 RepID=A0AAV9WSK5_9PEZI